MESTIALPAGTMLLDYRLDRVLGSGGFGITYRAHNVRLDTTVAIKEYFPISLAVRTKENSVISRPELGEASYTWGRDRFVHEATSLARLQHPNIVGVDYMFHTNGTAYMVLDYVDGPTLNGWLRSLNRTPTLAELERLLYPLLDALEIVHGKDLLHRDVAPKNIMIAPGLVPVLIDFGAARQLVAAQSRTFAAILTPGYAPFEQYAASSRGQGPWTDIYGLSATLYHAVTGAAPNEAPERMMQDRCVPARQAGHGLFPDRFLAAIDWGLSPLPKDRPPSIAAWRKAFGPPGGGASAQGGLASQRVGAAPVAGSGPSVASAPRSGWSPTSWFRRH